MRLEGLGIEVRVGLVTVLSIAMRMRDLTGWSLPPKNGF